MSEYRKVLADEFKDKEYREAYADDFLNTKIATQISTIREQRGLTREELGNKIGAKAEGVARLENVNRASWNFRTLSKVAHALDGRLNVSIETYGSLLDEAESFSRESLQRVSFDGDSAFQDAVVSANATSLPISKGLQDAFTGEHHSGKVLDFAAFKAGPGAAGKLPGHRDTQTEPEKKETKIGALLG
jgi:transcriptional regulator with XRE-family HTH domain